MARSALDATLGLRYEQAAQSTSRDLPLPEGEIQHAVPTVGLGWQIQTGLTEFQQQLSGTAGMALVESRRDGDSAAPNDGEQDGNFYTAKYEGVLAHADATKLHRLTLGAERVHDESAIGRVGLRQQLDEVGLTEAQKEEIFQLKAEGYGRWALSERHVLGLYVLARSYEREQTTRGEVASLTWELRPSELWLWQFTASGGRQANDSSTSTGYGPDVLLTRLFGVSSEVGVGVGQRWVEEEAGETSGTSARLHYQKRTDVYLIRLAADRSLSTSMTGVTTFQTDAYQLTGQHALGQSQRVGVVVTQKLETQLADDEGSADVESLALAATYTYGFGGAAATIADQFRYEWQLEARSEDLAVESLGRARRTEIVAGGLARF